MTQRQEIIGKSITHAILQGPSDEGFLARLPAYFHAHGLVLAPLDGESFAKLRRIWQIPEDEYRASFDDEKGLDATGDMGYSGSTFYTTEDSHYLVKSVPRHFEHSFFKHDLLPRYVDYMYNNPGALLVRITDFLEVAQHSVGNTLGLAPSHHIVMQNILYGKPGGSQDADNGWKDWDLKPMSYFYPERDVAGGALSSEATKSRLADDFDGKIHLTLDVAEHFKGQLEKDTRLLADCNAVDYSLFLVRMPLPGDTSALPDPPSWRTGVKSADGTQAYRAVILDFFWAKHKMQAKAMTGLINLYNVVDRQGPMSVTTDAAEYRDRFLKMCANLIEVA